MTHMDNILSQFEGDLTFVRPDSSSGQQAIMNETSGYGINGDGRMAYFLPANQFVKNSKKTC